MCALLGGFAVGAVHMFRCYGNSYKLACTPRYDNIVRTRNVSEYMLCLVIYSVDKLLLHFCQRATCERFTISHSGIPRCRSTLFSEHTDWNRLSLETKVCEIGSLDHDSRASVS